MNCPNRGLLTRAIIIAFSENGGADMEPVASGGRLAAFRTIEAGREMAGAFGVAVPVSLARARELCERYALGLPDLRETEVTG